MDVLNSEFIKGAVAVTDFPTYSFPEIAFAGRSNVGKSSLLNTIVLHRNLAHTSSTPGKTQEINFYVVEKRWSLADLPGFGYAAAGKKLKELWKKLNMEYLEVRTNLKLVCALVDSRHDPMPQDLALWEWLENNDRDFIITMTKCDKLSAALVEDRKKQIEEVVQNCNFCKEVLPTSAKSTIGRRELIAIIKKYCG